MKERLFESHIDLELKKVAEVVNEMLKVNIDLFKDKSSIEKWTSFPVVYYERKDIKEKFIQEVIYIDELLLSELDKLSCIVTLAGMMEIEQLKIKDMDLNSLFVLVNYFRNIKTDEMSNALKVLNDEELLEKIRGKFLDIEKRNFFISYVIEEAHREMKDFEDEAELKKYAKKIIQLLDNVDAYQLMEVSGYNDYLKQLEIKDLEEEVAEEVAAEEEDKKKKETDK